MQNVSVVDDSFVHNSDGRVTVHVRVRVLRRRGAVCRPPGMADPSVLGRRPVRQHASDKSSKWPRGAPHPQCAIGICDGTVAESQPYSSLRRPVTRESVAPPRRTKTTIPHNGYTTARCATSVRR